MWIGNPPKKCQLCHKDIVDCFIDGIMNRYHWCIMCKECHAEHGRGLGVGVGQRFEKKRGQWVKTGG